MQLSLPHYSAVHKPNLSDHLSAHYQSTTNQYFPSGYIFGIGCIVDGTIINFDIISNPGCVIPVKTVSQKYSNSSNWI
jgi:hypothetical protein